MALFTGTFENKVDAKLRVSLPADFRDLLAGDGTAGNGSFYIFPSPRGGFLEAYDHVLMQQVVASIAAQAEMFSEEEYALSYIPSEARRIQCDATGRFVLPAGFVEEASLRDWALFAGIGDRFQIWNPEHYQTERQRKRDLARASSLRLTPRSCGL